MRLSFVLFAAMTTALLGGCGGTQTTNLAPRPNQELYTRFRATQAFGELDKELKALDQSEGK